MGDGLGDACMQPLYYCTWCAFGSENSKPRADDHRRLEADFRHCRHIGELPDARWGNNGQGARFAGLDVRSDLAKREEADVQLPAYEIGERGWNAPVADCRQLDAGLLHQEFGAHMDGRALARLDIVELGGSRLGMNYQLRHGLRRQRGRDGEYEDGLAHHGHAGEILYGVPRDL